MYKTLLKTILVVNILSISMTSHLVRAAITTTGDVAPAPPAGGGNVVGPFNIGNTGTGTMSITGGTALTSTLNATVGSGVDAIGIVTMSGLGSNWTLTTAGADLLVGNSGVGSISLSSLARLNVADDTTIGNATTAMGQVSVSGLGTVWDNGGNINVGNSGFGILEVVNGGQVASITSVLGNNYEGPGRVTVSGEFSRWQITGALTVGDDGPGTLLVQNGGRVSQTTASVVGNGQFSSSIVEVSGAASLWAVGSTLDVGNFGTGTVRVLDGGRVTSAGTVTLALDAGSRGEVVVDGAGSLWDISSGSIIGSVGDATITISNGGVIRTSVVPNFSAKTRVLLDGGRLESITAGNISNSGWIEGSGTIDAGGLNLLGSTSRLYGGPGDYLVVTSTVSVGGLLDLNGGQLDTGTGVQIVANGDADLRNGGMLRAGGTGLQIFNGAQFAVTGGQGDIFGAVSNSAGGEIDIVGDSIAVFHDAVTNSGTIFVAPGSQMVTLEDLGFAAGSALNVGLAAIGPDDNAAQGFGQAVTSGAAALDGTLEVSLAGGYLPALEDTFQIVSAADGRSGVFATESLPTLPGFLGLDVVYTPNAVMLAVVPAIAGDYNVNGVVDAPDYVLWRNTLGQNGIGLAADGNGDGTINTADYMVWSSNFGNTAGSGAGNLVAVPEPAAWLLLLGLAAASVTLLCGRPMRAESLT